MKLAFIHNEKRIGTGANIINNLIASKLRSRHIDVRNFYPKFLLNDTPVHFKGINNILFFYSLLEKRDEFLRCDIIQGTTYTPLAFLQFSRPIVSHFGSTTIGFLRAVPKTSFLEKGCPEIFYKLQKAGVIKDINIKTRRPLNDISAVEKYAAEKVDYIIATSEIVKNDLASLGVNPDKITVIHNAIEDYWFDREILLDDKQPKIIFLGRIGEDAFTLKLKGVDRLIYLAQKFPDISKLSVLMSKNIKLITWLRNNVQNHTVLNNFQKDLIPDVLRKEAGSIALLVSRYEGFSLSLIELMSQKIVPISYPVGVAPELLVNGKNGFIVHSLEEAEEKINLLLNDSNLRMKLANNAYQSSKKFRAEMMIDQMITLYNKILMEKSSNKL